MIMKMGAYLFLVMLAPAAALAQGAGPVEITPAPKFVDGGGKSVPRFVAVRTKDEDTTTIDIVELYGRYFHDGWPKAG